MHETSFRGSRRYQSSSTVVNAVVEAATGRREEIVRPDFQIPVGSVWVGWTGDWDPLMLRDLGSDQIYRIDLDR